MASTTTKRKQRTPDWSIVFEDASSLRSVVDAVATVMARVSFKVVKKRDDYFLMVDSADVAMMCVVSARLRLDKVTFPRGNEESEFTFCVDCKHVSSAIDNPSCAHLALTMEGYVETAKLMLKMLDPETHSHEVCAELSTYVEEEPIELEDIEFKMILELDLQLVKEMIKKARKAHTEYLRIHIYLAESGAKKISLVVLSLDGDWHHEQKFCHETVSHVDGSLVVRAATDGTQKLIDVEHTEPFYKGSFPVEKIDAFIKNLPCRMLPAKVKTGVPIMLTYPLGGTSDETSHIRFLVAPINEEEA